MQNYNNNYNKQLKTNHLNTDIIDCNIVFHFAVFKQQMKLISQTLRAAASPASSPSQCAHRFSFESKVGSIVLSFGRCPETHLLPWPKRWIVNKAPPHRLFHLLLVHAFVFFFCNLPCSLAPHYLHMQHATCQLPIRPAFPVTYFLQ